MGPRIDIPFFLLSVSGCISCCVQDFSLQCEDSLVVVCAPSCSTACRIVVPQPGIEPVSPALQSEFLTTGPLGKSCFLPFFFPSLLCLIFRSFLPPFLPFSIIRQISDDFLFSCFHFMFWLKFRKWQPTPVFLPGRFHGQNSPADSSPWDGKESDVTEHTHTNLRALVFTVVPQPSHIYFSVYSRSCSLCVFPSLFVFLKKCMDKCPYIQVSVATLT